MDSVRTQRLPREQVELNTAWVPIFMRPTRSLDPTIFSENLSTSGRWYGLVFCHSDPQMVAQLVECTAETIGRLKASETRHRVVALFDRSMTLLHTVVQVLILAMQHLATDDPANCLRVGRMFVSRHPQKFLFCTVQQTPQKALCCVLVSVLTEHRIKKISISADRTVQVTPLTTDLDVGLI